MSERERPKKKEPPDAERKGSVSAADPELTTFLHGLWHSDEFPSRIEVYQIFNPKRPMRGEMIFDKDFNGNDKLDVERVNKLANGILAAAQNDCNCAKMEMFYQIVIIDLDRRAVPLVRRFGPLRPISISLVPPHGMDSRDEIDDDEVPGPKTQAERYTHLHYDQIRWEKQRNDAVLGDVVRLLGDMVTELRKESSDLRATNHKMLIENQDLFIRLRQADREGAWEDMKIELARDTYRGGRSLVTGFIGAASTGTPPKQIVQAVLENVKGQVEKNVERTLIDRFLSDCDRDKLLPQLFGKYTEDGPVKDAPGIFTPEQFTILDLVRSGELPPEALDEIMPFCGGKYEISLEQLTEAQKILPDGISRALLELKDIRDRKRATAIPQTQPAEQPTTNATN